MQSKMNYWISIIWLIFGTVTLCYSKNAEQKFVTVPLRTDYSYSTLNKFKCKSGQCIDVSLTYDGTDCEDGSDEVKCPISSTSIPVHKSLHTLTKRQVRKTCVIPPVKGNVYSNDSNPEDIFLHGAKVYESTLVNVNCEEGYYKNSLFEITMICLQSGNWRRTYPNLCLKMCPPVIADSLDLTCTYNGNYADCTKISVPGTKLTPKCKSTHHLENGKIETPLELTCNDNGKWIGGDLYTCQPICGHEITNLTLLIVNGTKVKYGSAPWNVGIYKLDDDKKDYKMICGGTLISSNLVVSAAHCFFNDDIPETTLTNIDGQYKIAVGKYTRDIKKMDSNFTQLINLQIIFLKNTYKALSGSYADDIAVIILQSNVTLSAVVSPVCMYWKNYEKYQLENGDLGKVVGWGYTEKKEPSPILLQTFLQYIERQNCLNKFPDNFQRYITHDKFCADDPSGRGEVSSGDSGAGLTFEHDKSHFLTGVVSSKDPDSNNPVATFTDVRYHIDWITQIYKDFSSSSFNVTKLCKITKYTKYGNINPIYSTLCSKLQGTTNTGQNTPPKKNKCVIPSTKGNLYYLRSKPNNYIPYGSEVQEHTTINVKCEQEYQSKNSSLELTTVCTSNGIWSRSYRNLCSKRCPPQISDNLEITCTYNDKYYNCSNPSIHGTKMTQKCYSADNIPNEINETPIIELQCDNGTWVGDELLNCQPKCGQLFVETKLSNVNGGRSKYGSAPWNIGIYKNNTKTNEYDIICGGSLISSKLIISAARCFWDKELRETIITNLKDRYKIGVGKYTRDFKQKDNMYTKYYDLLIVYLLETYYEGLYADDIAVVVLDIKVTFSTAVAPVCINWNKRSTVSNGFIGKVFGWGETEKNVSSPILLEKDLLFIDRKSCSQSTTYFFLNRLSNDKFCAGSRSELGRSGDTGTGLTFENNHSHFLTGIVNGMIEGQYNNNSIALLTDVRYYIDWITQIYKSVSSNSFDLTKTVCLRSGNWSSTYRQLCSKMCPPIIADSLDLTCTYNGDYIDCTKQSSIPGTKLTSKCKYTHYSEDEKMEMPMELQCHDNGAWIGDKLNTCHPICGKTFIEPKLLIVNGTETKYGSAPWNVGIYMLSYDNSSYQLNCGGSLISSNLVISAGSCFWDTESPGGIDKSLNKYKIAVGKYSLDYEKKDSMYTEMFDIQIIYTTENFLGYIFTSDNIAVIVLKNKVTFSHVVAPACMDWDKKYTVSNGSLGKIVGWGTLTYMHIPSPTLLEINIPYIDRKNCRKIFDIEEGYQEYLTIDKFCSIRHPGHKYVGLNDQQDYGAGFTTGHNNSQYLTGIVISTASDQSTALMTDVRYHIEWIKTFYVNYTNNAIEI